MPFSAFYGNSGVVHNLRDMLARQRFPQAMILAGPSGSGKYTLSLMLAQAMNCLQPVSTDGLPDFCGECSNCVRIAQANDLATRFTEAVEAREGLREADKKDTRIYVQTHPDVLVIPPDPPQLLVKVDQVRHITETIYFRPSEAREKLYIFPEASFMKEAANSLLKVLEEPPDFATLLLLAENPGQLLPTIRSRCMTVSLAALPHAEIEAYLAKHRSEWNARQRNLVARLSDGAVGRARTFDLEGYTAARNHALLLLSQGLKNSDHSELFKVTETYRAGAEGREKTDYLISTIYSLLHDLLFLNSGSNEMVRNVDILPELQKLAAAADFDWITMAAERLADVERGMRRNLLRSLSLDALAGALEGA